MKSPTDVVVCQIHDIEAFRALIQDHTISLLEDRNPLCALVTNPATNALDAHHILLTWFPPLLQSVTITNRSCKMPASKPSRSDSSDVWRRHASEIRKLYRNNTVENVKRFMEKEREFPEMA